MTHLWRSTLAQLSIAFMILTSGCKPATLTSTGPHPMAAAPTEGLRYYVPRDLLVVTANVTTRRQRTWAGLDSAGTCVASDETRTWRETVLNVDYTTAPDRRNVYRLASTPSGRVEQTLKVAVSDDGLLTALNYSAKDQAPEIVGNVLKAVAGIAGTIVGLPAVVRLGDREATTLDVKAADPKLALTDENCWALVDAGARRLRKQRLSLDSALGGARSARSTVLQRSAAAKSESDAKRYQIMDELQQRGIVFLESQLATVRTAVSAGATAYAASKGVGRSDTTTTFLVRVDVARIPATPAGRVTLEGYKRAVTDPGLRLLADSARAALYVEDLPSPSAATAAARPDTGSISCDDTKEEECTRIRFREPIPRVVSAYIARKDVDDAPLTWRESKTVNLISSNDPVLNIAFRSNQLGQASTGLTFSRRGSVTGIEQNSNAALAGATSTIATALSTARQEFVAGLQSVQTTQTTLEAMRQANRTSRIRELQDQKALIDAEVALQGASASRDLIAQKQSIDAQLALAQSQQALELANLRSETNAEVSALKVEMERLQIQIELLKKQMELEKARREAAELGSVPPG